MKLADLIRGIAENSESLEQLELLRGHAAENANDARADAQERWQVASELEEVAAWIQRKLERLRSKRPRLSAGATTLARTMKLTQKQKAGRSTSKETPSAKIPNEN